MKLPELINVAVRVYKTYVTPAIFSRNFASAKRSGNGQNCKCDMASRASF